MEQIEKIFYDWANDQTDSRELKTMYGWQRKIFKVRRSDYGLYIVRKIGCIQRRF